jgi:calcineurin-like phosphoesterase family protein
MNIWYTSDHHIGHRNIAKLRWEVAFPGIPAPDTNVVSWHDQMLAGNWDNMVAKDDIVWVLGDISSGADKGQREAIEWFAARPGRKRLIAGNHDSAHPMHRDAPKWQPIYLQAFEYVSTAAKVRIALPDKGHTSVFLSHLPYSNTDRGPIIRYPEWRMPNHGVTLLHGHTHGTQVVTYDEGAMQIHVGLDAHNFRPVPHDKIVGYVWKELAHY